MDSDRRRTNSEQERDSVLANYPQFILEGIVYYVFDASEPGTVPVWRFYNSISGAHFYTTSDDEVIYVEQHFPQFVLEGVRYGVYAGAAPIGVSPRRGI